MTEPSRPGLPGSILLLGAGRMGGSLLKGWLDAGVPGAGVDVIDPDPSDALRAMARSHGFGLNRKVEGLAPEAVVLAVKPQLFAQAAPMLAGAALGSAVAISIMAGRTVADVSARVVAAAVVRAMPNTPAAVGRGITGAFADARVTARQRAAADALLSCVGPVEWLASEALIDTVTAVSGSGPAYVFLLTECLAEAGRAAGLDPALAARLARATVEGAGALMSAEPGTGVADLRRAVTSPGGTTAAALDVLGGEGALGPLMIRAVAAARARAGELAG